MPSQTAKIVYQFALSAAAQAIPFNIDTAARELQPEQHMLR